jgi:hypothetical protein
MALMAVSGAWSAAVAGAATRARRHTTPRPTRRHRLSTNAQSAISPGSGGAGMGGPVQAASTPAQPTVPGSVAKIVNGEAYAPSLAPQAVKQAIWAGNAIRRKPYVYGGGHGSFTAPGYDCSGSVSYALHAGGLLVAPLDSGSFESWGARGRGRWITVFANAGHAYAVIAGLRFDTSRAYVTAASGTRALESGPRWRPTGRPAAGFVRRHPVGL